MYNSDYDNLDEKLRKEADVSATKWRRSGRDRRSDDYQEFFEEKRSFIGRRLDWFGFISSIIFPRGSKN